MLFRVYNQALEQNKQQNIDFNFFFIYILGFYAKYFDFLTVVRKL